MSGLHPLSSSPRQHVFTPKHARRSKIAVLPLSQMFDSFQFRPRSSSSHQQRQDFGRTSRVVSRNRLHIRRKTEVERRFKLNNRVSEQMLLSREEGSEEELPQIYQTQRQSEDQSAADISQAAAQLRTARANRV